MFTVLLLVAYFVFALYMFVPALLKAWKSGIWVARNNLWSRKTQPKRYWAGICFAIFNILFPTFIIIYAMMYSFN
ncbi:hypothetical protein B5P45_26905 [Phyllobacterium zundukense]|uniref:Uncharacterized protein n=1 Tax=Phyllobacterium zundukense TaxID=1867719 RepID=A0A2N9VQJ3_9HYPH|nr:hypothetical protein BLM14_20955 [Phyllobacterium zundukense]PIO41761.1 hypothetical protein B5P45_26905 [Phyllobacterium zundukense]